MAVADYELILMLDPRSAEAERNALVEQARTKLSSEGTLNHEESWGMRKMAYEIDARGEADYRYFRFSGEKPLLDQLNHALRITDGVLRFRIFRVDADSPVMVPPDTEAIMRRDEDEGRGRGRGDRGPRRGRDGDRPRREREPAAEQPDAPAEEQPAPAEAAAASGAVDEQA